MIPLGFSGESMHALIVGGGRVGTRRALMLLDAGARVRVIAPAISQDLDHAAVESDELLIERREYAGAADIGQATIVVAATSSPAVNERVVRDARAAGRPVSVANDPASGTFDFLATYRTGTITIGVSAGGVPMAAQRIRDSIAKRVDSRYANAVSECAEVRKRTLAAAGADAWRDIAGELIGDEFCESIEAGTFAVKVAKWR
jgi:siroheme synthase-like protein